MTIFYRETIICYLTHIVLIYADHRFALKNSQIESRFSIATKDIKESSLRNLNPVTVDKQRT